jgi:hypothetical protein
MPHISRSVLGVPVKFVVPAVLAACCTVAASRRGAELWSPPRVEEEADPEPLHGREVSEDVRAVTDRIVRKQALAEEIIEGRMTLLEAAARFRALDEAPPRFHWEQFRRGYPGAGDEERHCREAIGFVRTWLEARGYEPGSVVPRLEAELQEHLDRGDLRLPAVVSATPVAAGPTVTP